MREIQLTRHTGMRRCFTLIELLIVIAIIAILAAMLFPALNKVKGFAKGAECLSRSKVFHSAYLFYADNENGWLPGVHVDTAYTGVSQEEHGSAWRQCSAICLWLYFIEQKAKPGWICRGYMTADKFGRVGFCPEMNSDFHGQSVHADKSTMELLLMTGSFGSYFPNTYADRPMHRLLYPSKTSSVNETKGNSQNPITQYNSFFNLQNQLVVTTKKHLQKASTMFMDGHGAHLSVDEIPIVRTTPYFWKPWGVDTAGDVYGNPVYSYFWISHPPTGYSQTPLGM